MTGKGTIAGDSNLTAVEQIKCDRKPNWSSDHAGLRLAVWFPKWPGLANRGEYERRDISFAISDAQDRVVAAGEFEEWAFFWLPEKYLKDDQHIGVPNLRHWCENEADAHDDNSYQAAHTVLRAWGPHERKTDETPFEFGSIVIFDRLRIEAGNVPQSGAVWVLIQKLIDRQFKGKQNCSAMILIKPFPLEYTGDVNSGNAAAFARRRDAMVRLYGARLGARLLDQRDRWLWIRTNDGLPEPRRERRKKAALR
ncbi:hypothetical protein SAMN05443248_1633 [Bradyrhizobium erythrophlei]|uniref:Uncharacterized protein n=2 Tax=Bradyrhizobium erythrophlei TaxID=1437360 RepID=A0A1M5JZV1_9BRAD|nr:hypothetical protein SAMN05443248_1633 [Bradyrhizobium erythrophlei]